MTYHSSLKLTSAIPMAKEDTKKAKQILQTLIDSPDSFQFREPVDWKTLGLMDYLTIVKKPMDLQTVSTKLTAEQYEFIEENLDDVQLIWDNCKAYNLKGSWIFSLAEKMQRLFKKLLKNYFPAVQFSSTNAVQKVIEKPKPAVKETPAPLLVDKPVRISEQQLFRETKPSLAAVPVRPSSLKPQKKPDHNEKLYYEDEEEISYTEKLKLAEKLMKFPAENMRVVVEYICTMCPPAFQEGEEEANILVDNMDVITFRQVMEKVDEEMNQFIGSKHLKVQ